MIVTHWSSRRRTLSSGEVDGTFAAAADQVLVYAFRTDHMDVGRHSGNFSLKFVVEGEERYRFGSRAVMLQPGRLLLANEGERYASSIRAPNTQAVSLFVPRRLVAAAQDAMTHSQAPSDASRCAVSEVVSVPFRPCRATLQRMQLLQANIAAARAGGTRVLEHEVLDLVRRAMAENLGLIPTQSPLLARRARAGRLDVVRRLLLVREFLEDLRGTATLEQMAAIACLSKFHFLRAFTEVFGVTPARFARSLRLQSGRHALGSGHSAAAAARIACYCSASAFLRAMRTRRTGKSAISASPQR